MHMQLGSPGAATATAERQLRHERHLERDPTTAGREHVRRSTRAVDGLHVAHDIVRRHRRRPSVGVRVRRRELDPHRPREAAGRDGPDHVDQRRPDRRDRCVPDRRWDRHERCVEFRQRQARRDAWSGRNGSGATACCGCTIRQWSSTRTTRNLWVGADIGVSHSTDGGTAVWRPLSNNLPDSAVVDLDLHPVAPRMFRLAARPRRLRDPRRRSPATSGRAVVRTNRMDTGRGPAVVTPILDPLDQTVTLAVDQSPDILTDPPDANGRLVADPTTVDAVVLSRDLAGRPREVLTNPAGSGSDAITKVHVRVRNRGPVVADGVSVMLLIGRVDAARNDLPAGYAAQVAAGTPIETADWHTVGFRSVDGVGGGRPVVATFDLRRRSSRRRRPASVSGCRCSRVHHAQDPYNSNVRVVDNLVTNDRRAAVVTAAVVAASGAAGGGATVPPVGSATNAPLTADPPPRAARLLPAGTAPPRIIDWAMWSTG